MTRPAVTVGIPFYKDRLTLADAVRSVFVQSLEDWELILINDGSTDGGLEVARSVCDDRVRVVSDDRNLGLSARLNQIAELARAKFLARMDADDLMHSDRLGVQAEYLERNPGVDVVGTGMYILDADGRPIAKRPAGTLPLTARRVLTGACLMHATVMGRTDWFRRNPYYDPASSAVYPEAEDFELWCRTFGASRFARIPACYYYCNEHASFSMSKYATASRSVARAQWRHGLRQIGFLGCCALSARQAAKFLVHAGAAGLRLQRSMIARRSFGLTPSEAEKVAADLRRIRSVILPTRLGEHAGGRPQTR
jgi:glycosyltransferase involved in cell wall biosynthesis